MTCSSTNNCQVCYNNFVLSNNTCTCPLGTNSNDAASPSCVCPISGQTYNPATTLCVNNCNVTNCIMCNENNTCAGCLANYQLKGNTCAAFCLINNCQSCLISGLCFACNTGFQISTYGDACISVVLVTVNLVKILVFALFVFLDTV